TSVGLSGDAEPERVDAATVSTNIFSVLGVRAAAGRVFAVDETASGRPNAIVLSDGLWTRRFGRDGRIIGKTVVIEGAPYVVIGVMPSEFGFPSHDTQLWMPVVMPPSRSGA